MSWCAKLQVTGGMTKHLESISASAVTTLCCSLVSSEPSAWAAGSAASPDVGGGGDGCAGCKAPDSELSSTGGVSADGRSSTAMSSSCSVALCTAAQKWQMWVRRPLTYAHANGQRQLSRMCSSGPTCDDNEQRLSRRPQEMLQCTAAAARMQPCVIGAHQQRSHPHLAWLRRRHVAVHVPDAGLALPCQCQRLQEV